MTRFERIGFFLFSLPLLALASCGGQNSNASDTTTTNDTFPTQMDSVIAPDTVAAIEKKEVTFASSADALKFMQDSGHWDNYQSGILPRMAEENLEYCQKLLNNEFDYFIVVDKAVMKVILYSKYGNVVKEYGMACAKNYGTKHKKGDSRTIEGFFTAEGIYDSTNWLFTNDAGYTSPARGQFGPRFIRLKSPVTSQIGIHGTASPGSIGRRVSHGCIRIKNENILELVKYAKKGMPIIVSPGPKDMAVNKAEGYNIPAITTGATKIEPSELPSSYKKEAAAQGAAAKADKSAPGNGNVEETTPAETSPESTETNKPEEKKTEEKKTEEKKPESPAPTEKPKDSNPT